MIPDIFDQINDHFGHAIEIARYSHPASGKVANVSVECMDCHEVIVDADAEWMVTAKEAVYGQDGY